ncbi:hypothetical protein NA56DRAFT_755736 [Hyaloscypha hepaticicola]|uniref:Uncharacterized protein n=1 Tax=Hyaloscypha hepaticicola TaxID=2082293 RepID=A0A2J6PHI4_9HELO|nr:hypothetical protein NA56DRAFT_755736 [Hyaloscypha hepaticicola]
MPFQPEFGSFITSLRSTTTPPSDLDLIKRQQPQNFVGYTFSNSLWIPLTCAPGATFVESKPFGSTLPGYAGCCTGPCTLATICVHDTIYYPNSYSSICGLGSSCVTGIVATSEGAELQGDLYLGCDNFVQDWVAYKTAPAANSSPKPTPSMTSSQTTPSSSSPTPTRTTTITSSPTAISNHNSLSGAAISGTVVGPICGVALILGLAFLYFRRSRNKSATAGSSNVQSPPQGYTPGPAPFGGYTGDKPELAAINPLNPRPMSIPPVYLATEMGASTNIPRKEVPSPTVSYGTGHAMSLPVPFKQQFALNGQ